MGSASSVEALGSCTDQALQEVHDEYIQCQETMNSEELCEHFRVKFSADTLSVEDLEGFIGKIASALEERRNAGALCETGTEKETESRLASCVETGREEGAGLDVEKDTPVETEAQGSCGPDLSSEITDNNEPQYGVSLEFILKFIKDRNIPDDMPTFEVVKRYIIPETAESRLSYVQAHLVGSEEKERFVSDLRPGHRKEFDESAMTNNRPLSMYAFISHPWKMPFTLLVDLVCQATTQDMWNNGLRDVPYALHGLANYGLIGFPEGSLGISPHFYYWIDVFCKNQHVPSPAMNEFYLALQAPGKVIIPLWPTDKPICLTRIWCLYEILSAIQLDTKIVTTFEEKSGTISDVLALTEDESKGDGPVESFVEKLKAKLNFDVRGAEATVPEDIPMILQLVEDSIGVSNMNSIVYTAIGSFLQQYLANNHDFQNTDLSLPCFDGSGLVRMGDKSEKQVHDIVAGDEVLTGEGVVARVELVTKSCVPGGSTPMCCLNGVLLTPEHPVFDTECKAWRVPSELVSSREEQIDTVYNLELEEGHSSVLINGLEVLTLGQTIGFDEESDRLYGWGWRSNPARRRYLLQQEQERQ